MKGDKNMPDTKSVFRFFEELSRIPRASGDEGAAADYLVAFAEARGLKYTRDAHNNVVIKKPGRGSPVIIQGHTDMVYVREADCTRAYADGIGLLEQDGWITADGTTLGADNGIAVAFALAVLDSPDFRHPPIEAVFTTEEEVGLIGAGALDFSLLDGRLMLNLDTEDEGVFYTSCAGAFRNDIRLPLKREQVKGLAEMTLQLSGLMGGHSGIEIHMGRGNAITLLARLLDAVGEGARLVSLSAEGKTNAISNNARAVLLVEQEKCAEIEAKINALTTDFRRELGERDSLTVTVTNGGPADAACYTQESQQRILRALLLLPSGVIRMSLDVPGLVETSANPAILEQEEDALMVLSSLRSSVGSRKREMRARYAAIAALCGGESVCSGDYPQWEYRAESPLRTLALETYRELSGREGKTAAIHAGLECGYFDARLEGVDIISYGPNIEDVHTPRERMELASVERVWAFTVRLLERLAE